MVTVFINQEPFLLSGGHLSDVLAMLEIDRPDGIAMAVNEDVIPREEWASHVLRESDRVFVIRATQGG